MPEPKETLSELIEREFDSYMRFFKRRRWLALMLLLIVAVYGWHQYIWPIMQDIQKISGPTAESFKSPAVSNGAVGWIYVGTWIDGQWKHSTADKNEPELTLNLLGLPEPSNSYQVTHPLFLREAPPAQQANKSRPPMETSKGAIGINSVVKVDSVTQIEITEVEHRSWVWAHVTVINAH